MFFLTYFIQKLKQKQVNAAAIAIGQHQLHVKVRVVMKLYVGMDAVEMYVAVAFACDIIVLIFHSLFVGIYKF